MKKFFACLLATLVVALVFTSPASAGGKEIAETAISGVEKGLVEKIASKGAVVSKSSYSCISCSSELWNWTQGSYVTVSRCEDSYRTNRKDRYEYVGASAYYSKWNDDTGEYSSFWVNLDPQNVVYTNGVLTAVGLGVEIVCEENGEYSADESTRTQRTDSTGYRGQARHEYHYSTATMLMGANHPPFPGFLNERMSRSKYDAHGVCKGGDCSKGGGGKG